MLSIAYRPMAAIGALVAFALLSGCQHYQPRPLNLPAHREAWLARTATDESVSQFAQRLGAHTHSGQLHYDPADGIDAQEAELIALVYNADLRLARLRAGVARASADHASRWDDPQLAVDLLRVTDHVPDRWIQSAGLAITLPISGRLAAEQARADAAYQAELYAVAEAEWRVRNEVRQAWLAWSAAVVKLEQQDRLLEQIVSLVDTTKKLAEAGELPQTEAGLFAIERTQRAYEQRRLRGQIQVLEQELRSLMGLSPLASLQFIPRLDVMIERDELMSGSFDHNPMLTRLGQEYEVAEQTLNREIRKQYPDLTIGPVVESDQGQSRIGLSGGIPLAIISANRRGIAEAYAERELARAAFETAYEQLAGSLAQARARALALSDERAMVAEELAPLIDQQVERARQLLELGEGGGLVLLESLVRGHEARLHLIDLRLEEARAFAQLIDLSGPDPALSVKPVPDNTPPQPPSAESAEEVSP